MVHRVKKKCLNKVENSPLKKKVEALSSPLEEGTTESVSPEEGTAENVLPEEGTAENVSPEEGIAGFARWCSRKYYNL